MSPNERLENLWSRLREGPGEASTAARASWVPEVPWRMPQGFLFKYLCRYDLHH